jgi:hypothetical protein
MNYTYEELIAMGFDAETASTMAKVSGGAASGGMPFPILKMNYDKEDVLVDAGVKKGNFISGWVVDKKTLTVKETGEDLGNSLEFFVVGSVYQSSHYDVATFSTTIMTDIYFSSYDTPKMIDKKSKKTIKQLKDEGKKVTFNNILLLMIKQKDGSYAPYMHYLHGTSYHKFGEACENLGVDTPVLKWNFEVGSTKVATNFQPAFCFDIKKVVPRDPVEIAKQIAVTSEAIKKFNKWIESTNSSGSNEATPTEGISPQGAADDDDIRF